ncbi:hypothetical protein [Aquamicrobium defluvii]|uniref:2,4-dienoyl-CoA reductase-like NADH-dependent reductase (Old Yellow Enzyme family) n=1 Tax=Aquamicrobium defluvii TaxID=69279 RepID=A0A011V591_9HYPH|nr:hypothetical protein [Aquamicrobium defluvii]EXL03620.1 oxidoreductase [Aquamicrobium defluvii]TDR32094.1 2,4-dienoyl-CoA reductase-like NADH-dependent reductase (Old Yellow Enzyme family) [Aquamicrobium defluvii]
MFQRLLMRGTTFRNRVLMSPMCMYAAEDGFPDRWHLAHYGARAAGGVGGIIVEATAVSPEGRITPGDLGIWNEAQVKAHGNLVDVIERDGAVAGIQLSHAGRRSGRTLPWNGNRYIAGEEWGPRISASALAYSEASPVPHGLKENEIRAVIGEFAAAARRAAMAGYRLVELHFAHGYLLHQFISPLTNHRSDGYGVEEGVHTRLPVEIVEVVRDAVGPEIIVSVRLSVVDWIEGGLRLEHSVRLSAALKSAGADIIDVSSGALVPGEKISPEPGYHAPFARAIREETGVATAVVGLVTEPRQAQAHLDAGDADLILLGRALLRDPYWVAREFENAENKGDLFPLPYRRALAGMKTRRVW